MTISTWANTADGNKVASPNGFVEGEDAEDVNDTFRQIMADYRAQHEGAEWIDEGHTPNYQSGTSFRVDADQTGIYQASRRVRVLDGATYKYGTISASTYAEPYTTVTVTLDSGSTDFTTSITAVAYGILSVTNSSVDSSLLGGGSLAAKDTLATADFDNATVSVEHISDTSPFTMFEKITATTLSSDASIAFTSISADYHTLRIVMKDVVLSATAQILLAVSDDNGSTYEATGYAYAGVGNTTAGVTTAPFNETGAGILLSGGSVVPQAGYVCDVVADILVYPGGQKYLTAHVTSTAPDAASSVLASRVTGHYLRTASGNLTVDALRVSVTTGNMTSGTVTLYGIASYGVPNSVLTA